MEHASFLSFTSLFTDVQAVPILPPSTIPVGSPELIYFRNHLAGFSRALSVPMEGTQSRMTVEGRERYPISVRYPRFPDRSR